MHCISSHGYDLHVTNSHIVFRERRALPQQRDLEDAFWKYDLNLLTPIDQTTYYQVKFGQHFTHILRVCEREPPSVAWGLDGSIAVCDFASDPIRLFDSTGRLKSILTLRQTVWSSTSIYALALTEQHIWLALPTEDVVLALTYTGDVVHTLAKIFSYPESLTRINTSLYVCDMGNRRLCMIDFVTLQITVIAQFEEPVWEYVTIAGQHIIRLQSGIYQSTDLASEPISKPAG